jgi:hypothetical protein
MKPKLTVVDPKPERKVVDLYEKWRAEIRARDWGKVHVIGGRNPPLELCDRPKWKGWK